MPGGVRGISCCGGGRPRAISPPCPRGHRRHQPHRLVRSWGRALSNHLLKDFALTSKLPKLANVASYKQVGGGSISTLSRAVVVLGFAAVRSIALILSDNLEDKAHGSN